MLWLALHPPALWLDLLRRRGLGEARPRALLAGDSNPPRIAALCPRAAGHGLVPGLSVAEACARLPALLLVPPAPRAEREALERVASCAGAVSSRVLVLGGGVVLEVGASLGLFGGLEALRRKLRARLAPLGLGLREGLAPTTEAALLLARAGGGEIPAAAGLRRGLDPLPLAAAPLPPATLEALAALGLRRVGELLRLPRPALAARHGAELAEWIARLLGERAEDRPSFRPPELPEVALELPGPASTSEALRLPLARLCRELGACLAARGLGALALALELLPARERQPSPRAGLRSPSAEPARLARALEAALAGLRLAAPVEGLRLRALEVAALAPAQGALWAAPRPALELPALIERLEQRLGPGIGVPAGPGLRAPPRARLAAAPGLAGSGGGAAAAASRGPRPAWLLPEPCPVRPEDYELLAGPERIESGWWDGADLRRDYHLARDREGRRCWLFRDRDGWFLHGLFA
ncbi:MAG: hypothetical protein RML12_06770 [Xanthomonadales bacterium]|nr:hypothetical protein [Xanthomonadales bacterium]